MQDVCDAAAVPLFSLMYTVSHKNNIDVAHYNFSANQLIYIIKIAQSVCVTSAKHDTQSHARLWLVLIIFGSGVAERVSYRVMICYTKSSFDS